ncbi:permease [Enterocloster citroniae]|uniref:permease n=1 Tax=Enterocloster citroniae TaxID=358743 RepID=UPI00058D9772|nr:permease [Enterocloster citroniae]MCC3383185.1 permease [Enterocloster citroniae]
MGIPVWVITGLLDSGKTTLINQLIERELDGLDLLVIQFESGEVTCAPQLTGSRSHTRGKQAGRVEKLVFSKGRLEQSPFFIVNSIRNCLKQRGPGQGPDLILMEWNGMEHFHKLEEMFLQFTAKTAIHIKKVVYVTQESGLTTGIPNAGAAAFSQIGASDCAFISRRGRRHMGRMTGILSGCNPGIKVFHQRKWDSFVSEMFRSPIPPCFWFLTAAAAAGIYGGICSGLNGLDFPAGRFVSTFLGVFLQAAPFLALGALLSSLIQVYVQPSWIRRTFPKTVLAGQLFAVAAGFCLPVCDCASIPVFKGLVKKGVPLPAAVTFMLVSPVINPVVVLSTWYAFNGNYRIVAARCVLGIVCAVLCGLTFLIRTPGDCLCEDPVPVQAGCVDYRIPAWKGTGQSRLGLVIRHGQNEFFSVGKFLLIGIFVSSLFQKMVPGGLRAGEGTDPWIALLLMMGMAFVLSLCSSSDAVVAGSMAGNLPMGAILGFLVFGPMMDIKNAAMLRSGCRPGFVVRLLFTTFLVCFLVTALFMACQKGGVPIWI